MPSSGYTAISFTAGEQPTTAKWNLVGSNDASFNTGNGFNDGIIVQRHHATNGVPGSALDVAAIRLGKVSITSNFTTNSTTFVPVTGLSLTVTVPAGGRDVELTLRCIAQINAVDAYAFAIYKDGVYMDQFFRNEETANYNFPWNVTYIDTAPTAGSHTYAIYTGVGAGTDIVKITAGAGSSTVFSAPPATLYAKLV